MARPGARNCTGPFFCVAAWCKVVHRWNAMNEEATQKDGSRQVRITGAAVAVLERIQEQARERDGFEIPLSMLATGCIINWGKKLEADEEQQKPLL